ncbi:hypothetical protein F5B20DRAFT_583570 [Whalleya microplaca]|nr:hypothetical protein F5B20DRAFT_583570 [Whalleya microplaca]
MEGQKKRHAEDAGGSSDNENEMKYRKLLKHEQIKHEHPNNQPMALPRNEAYNDSQQPYTAFSLHSAPWSSFSHAFGGVVDTMQPATANITPSINSGGSSFSNNTSSFNDHLVQVKRLHDGEVQQLREHIQTLRQRIDMMEKATATTPACIEGMVPKKQHEGLMSELHGTVFKAGEAVKEKDQQCQELQRKLAETITQNEQRCQEMLQKWQAAENQLAQLRQLPEAAPDSVGAINQDEVIKVWKSLKYRIINLVRNKFQGLPFRTATKNEQKEFFSRMSVDYDELFLRSDELKGYFIEAAIWQKLLDEILLVPASVFTKEAGRTVLYAQQQALGSNPRFDTIPQGVLKNYHEWRTHTGQALYKIYSSHLKNEDVGKNEQWNGFAIHLAQFFSRYSSQPDEDSLRSDFHGILKRAIDLAALLARSRAHYELCMAENTYSKKLHDFHYDEDWMEAECEGFEGRGVDLIVSPALFKYGDENGEHYDQRKVVVQARVIW